MREMKDSGIEWIGEIPLEWEINKIKYMFSNGKGLPITKENLIDEGLPVISYGQIHSKDNNGTKIGKNLLRFVNEKYSMKYPQCSISENDFVFADTSEDYDGCGNCVLKRDNSKVFAGYHTIILHSLLKRDNRFLAYLFKTDIWRKQIREKASGVKVFSITQKTLMNCKVILPGYNEEKIIANYLDTQCSEIDAIAEDIQKEISLLEDYKKSVITEVVTKGLNPDAEMKDSGIAWIGDIPKDWDLLKIGYVTKEISDIDHYMPSDSDDIDKVPYVMIGDLKENISQIDFESCKYISKKVYRALSIKSKPEKGNVIFARYATIGTVCFVDSEKQLLVSYACLTVKANELIKGKFLFYYFKSNAFLEEVSQYVKSNTQGNIGKESLIRAKIVVPKLKEQTQIISYLDSKCSEIDAIIADKKRQRGILAEYKKSLIYEYVTGKKEVPINE